MKMQLPRRRFLQLTARGLAGALALPAFSRIASAQNYPSRPITLVVPFAAGGPSEVEGIEAAAVSFPGFVETLRSLGAAIEVAG